jgi:hypothetical protein
MTDNIGEYQKLLLRLMLNEITQEEFSVLKAEAQAMDCAWHDRGNVIHACFKHRYKRDSRDHPCPKC